MVVVVVVVVVAVVVATAAATAGVVAAVAAVVVVPWNPSAVRLRQYTKLSNGLEMALRWVTNAGVSPS